MRRKNILVHLELPASAMLVHVTTKSGQQMHPEPLTCAGRGCKRRRENEQTCSVKRNKQKSSRFSCLTTPHFWIKLLRCRPTPSPLRTHVLERGQQSEPACTEEQKRAQENSWNSPTCYTRVVQRPRDAHPRSQRFLRILGKRQSLVFLLSPSHVLAPNRLDLPSFRLGSRASPICVYVVAQRCQQRARMLTAQRRG